MATDEDFADERHAAIWRGITPDTVVMPGWAARRLIRSLQPSEPKVGNRKARRAAARRCRNA